MEIILRFHQDIQSTFEGKIFKNFPMRTNVNELDCLTLNQKCAYDIQINVQTIVLNGFIGQYLSRHPTYTRCPCIPEILAVFNIDLKM